MEKNAAELLEQVLEVLQATPNAPTEKPITEKVIIVSAEDRQRIEHALGVNISTSKELADRIVRAMSVSVAGVEVPLTPYLLDRLKSRAIRVEWEKFVPLTIKRLIEEYVGVR